MLVAGTGGSIVGAEPQGGARGVEVAVDKAERKAQTSDRLLVLPRTEDRMRSAASGKR